MSELVGQKQSSGPGTPVPSPTLAIGSLREGHTTRACERRPAYMGDGLRRTHPSSAGGDLQKSLARRRQKVPSVNCVPSDICMGTPRPRPPGPEARAIEPRSGFAPRTQETR